MLVVLFNEPFERVKFAFSTLKVWLPTPVACPESSNVRPLANKVRLAIRPTINKISFITIPPAIHI